MNRLNRARFLVVMQNNSKQRVAVAEAAPPFSFGAIVSIEGKVPDGQIIKFLDPAYSYLLDYIAKRP